MFNRRAADIIFTAPTTWSTTIMTDNRETCVDPYLDSFAQSFAAANYTAGTIRTYRHLARKLGRLMDTGGIAPSALTPDLADQLARTAARGPGSRIRLHNLARQFAEHLIDTGVAQPVPLTEAQIARAALLADYEAYLVKQRGLSPRTIYHVLRFADRFLDHRFGTAMIDLTRLRARRLCRLRPAPADRQASVSRQDGRDPSADPLPVSVRARGNGDQPCAEHPQGGQALGCTTAPAPVARWGRGGSRLGARQPPAWRA